MKYSSVGLMSFALGTGILVVGGCAFDQAAPTAPAAVAPAGTTITLTASLIDSLATLYKVPVIARLVPLLKNEEVKQTIGPAGGTITLPNSKTTITFAPGAVDKSTTITATAYAGLFVSYGFAPHGLKFKAPVTLTTDLTTTIAFLHPEWATTMSGGYTPDGQSNLDGTGGATVSEQNVATVKTGSGGTTLTSASFNIPHFSGYILAGGRSSSTSKTTATK